MKQRPSPQGTYWDQEQRLPKEFSHARLDKGGEKARLKNPEAEQHERYYEEAKRDRRERTRASRYNPQTEEKKSKSA